jgi:polyisoprenyl-teichoic acid--peptidoglycan teichoic acid transferase
VNPQEPAPSLAKRMWVRFAFAGLIIVAFSAAATATAGLLEVKDLSEQLHPSGKAPIKVPELTPVEKGPQTILLMGSDVRKVDRQRGLKGNSDTMILVRLDPTKKATALLSIPRDLKVSYPGINPPKINGAFPIGGTRLTVKVIQKTLPGIEINHVVNTNFKGFQALVNKVDCVYVDIDRRYFNDNAIAYATIDVKPGYQKMCGSRALDYVRFRHEDTDLVRGARQQDFIRQARSQVGVQRILKDRKEFLRLFGKYTDTDIHGLQQTLSLLKVIAFSAGHPLQEVRFRTDIGPSYVTSSPAQIRATVHEFLNVQPSKGPRGVNRAAPPVTPGKRRRKVDVSKLGLEEAKTAGEDQAIAAAPHVNFPVLFPRLRKAGSLYVDVPRTYVIDGPDGKRYPSYRIVARTGELGAYYGIQGTTWRDPPILANPSETQKVGGKTYYLYGDVNRLRLVAVKTPRASYWVSNTVLLSLNNRQMLAIAKSLQRIGT